MKYLTILLVVALFLGSVGLALAAPTSTILRTILPETTSTYDLGSASKVWNNLYVNTITTSAGTAVSGSGTSGRAAFWNGTNSLSSDSTFLFDSALDKLTVTNASTTALSVTGTGTTTFAGAIDLTSGSSHITAHGLRSDASDGLHVHANNWTDVAILGVGNTANSLFYGGVNIDGATRLATSLTGFLKATSGAVTAVSSIVPGDISLTKGNFLVGNDAGVAQATSTIFISSTGNVGIGTTTPSAKLGIGGTGTLFELLDTAGSMVMRVVSSTVTLLGTWDFSGATVKTHEYSSFTYATSTAWTATTTIPLGPAAAAESWDDVMCFTDTGTLNVSIYDGTNRMNMFNASTTVGTVDLSTNNTFTVAEKRYVDVGTPASTPTKISCTVDRIVNF